VANITVQLENLDIGTKYHHGEDNRPLDLVTLILSHIPSPGGRGLRGGGGIELSVYLRVIWYLISPKGGF
jgi:hypothetical protein